MFEIIMLLGFLGAAICPFLPEGCAETGKPKTKSNRRIGKKHAGQRLEAGRRKANCRPCPASRNQKCAQAAA